VASYNINYGNVNLPAIVETIARSDADLVCLQETNRQSELYLRRRLGRTYRHMTFRHSAGAGGYGFLSKSPVRKRSHLPRRHGVFGTWIAEVKLGGRDVQIVNVHLLPTIPRRGQNAKQLVKLLLKTEGIRGREIAHIHSKLRPDVPTILAGDLNSVPGFPVTRYLAARGMIDSFRSAAPKDANGFTWHWPWRGTELRQRFDYIFHSDHVKTCSSEVIRSEASDHYLLVSTLTWAPKKTSSRPARDSRERKSD
jgi:endonuclease/exonuclease/phosphatase family metal-dependent hydrolase